jgi:hypothetical protein
VAAHIDRILWLDSAGEAVLSADVSLPGFVPNLKERDYFKQAIRGNWWPDSYRAPRRVPNLKERDYLKQAIWGNWWPNSYRAPDRDSFLLASVVNYGATSDKTAVVVQRSQVPAFASRDFVKKSTAGSKRRSQAPVPSPPKGNLLSKDVARPRVCLYSTELRCLDRPVLPPGYSFCLIDASGEVLFHSDPNSA